MNKVAPRIRQFRMKVPVSTRHSQQFPQELELLSSPIIKDNIVKPTNQANFPRRKPDFLPSIKDRISRASSIM